jgi:hypothetical protein
MSRRTTTTAASDAVASILALIGVVGAVSSVVLAGLGAVTNWLILLGCAGDYRSTFLEVNDPPVDCLAGPAWPLVQWFALVGVGALLTFSTLVIGAYRPRVAVPVGVLLAAVTAVGAVLTLPAVGPWSDPVRAGERPFGYRSPAPRNAVSSGGVLSGTTPPRRDS